MKEEIVKVFCLFLSLVVVSSIAGIVYAPPLPLLYVDPEENTANPGETFSINVNVQGVDDLFGWGLRMEFNPNVLRCIDVTEGPFLKRQPGGTSFTKKITLSYIMVGVTTLGAYPGVSGSGTLMTATFQVKASGTSDLDIIEEGLQRSKLLDSTITEMNHTVADGYFYTTTRADLVRRSAWPEHHHFVVHKDEDFNGTHADQTLFCKVKNLGPLDLYVYATFDIVRDDGLVTILSSAVVVVPPETIVTLTANFVVTSSDAGKCYVNASAWYSSNGYYYAKGDKTKSFSFAVVP